MAAVTVLGSTCFEQGNADYVYDRNPCVAHLVMFWWLGKVLQSTGRAGAHHG
jgi:hypothetical protein